MFQTLKKKKGLNLAAKDRTLKWPNQDRNLFFLHVKEVLDQR